MDREARAGGETSANGRRAGCTRVRCIQGESGPVDLSRLGARTCASPACNGRVSKECVSTNRRLSRGSWGCSDSKRCFFGDFLCTSKESYPLGRRTSGSSALNKEKNSKIKVDSLFRGNDVSVERRRVPRTGTRRAKVESDNESEGEAMDSRYRGNESIE